MLMLAHGILQISFESHANKTKEKDCKKILTYSKICQKRGLLARYKRNFFKVKYWKIEY